MTILKRVFDIVSSLFALLALSPVMFIIGVLLKFSEPSEPIFFTQNRVGRNEEIFKIFKFRTMRSAGIAGTSTMVTAANDFRITPIGRFLRNSKIDEIPQFLNVILGEMSVVGPRPEVPKYTKLLDVETRSIVYSVKPGITDPTSIEMIREEEILAKSGEPEKFYIEKILPMKNRKYIEYVKNQSLSGDLRIIVKTLYGILSR